MQLAHVNLLLSLSRIAAPVSPLVTVLISPHVNIAAAPRMCPDTTVAVAAGASTAAAAGSPAVVYRLGMRPLHPRRYSYNTAHGSRPSFVRQQSQQQEQLHYGCSLQCAALDQDETPPAKHKRSFTVHNKTTPVAEDIAPLEPAVRRGKNQDKNGQDQSGMDSVVAQLRSDMAAGSTARVQSRLQLDGLFAELRTGELMNNSIALARGNSTSPSARPVDATATSLRLTSGFDNVKGRRARPTSDASKTGASATRQYQASTVGVGTAKGSATPSSIIEKINEDHDLDDGGGKDLASLSEMLGRLQANAKARDLAEAGARAALIRSGGSPTGESLASVTMAKQKDLVTRFASIREGRVSWAVLPLVVRARKAGIPLSTGVYNAAIAAYFTTPHKFGDALRVLDLLKRSGDPDVRPDRVSYNVAMRVCGEAGEWKIVFKLMAQMQASGIEPNTETYNCALNGLAKRREWYRARRLFRKMVAGGRCTPDVVTYNGLVEAAGMGSLSPRQDMIQIVHEMEQAGEEPTAYTYTVLLDCMARRRHAFDGYQIMARLVDARAPLLPRGYRAGLLFCKEFGDWRRAMALMEDMRVAKRRPSGAMFLSAVQACAKGGQWERALSLMVERRTVAAKEAKDKRDEGDKSPVAALTNRAKRHAGVDMKTLEAVLGAASEAGQFEVAIRLVQQLRAAGETPSKKCYLYTLRAASKWGRWDVIEGLLKDMHQLGVGLVRLETPDSLPEGWGGLNNDSTVMSSECYTPLVEAYAQASMWERTIETYRKGFGLRHGRVEVVNYRVYECVLKACVETGDGVTALEVIQRQATEPARLQRLLGKKRGSVSGGPPDRRCWCLAAEALGRAGMFDEGRGVLRAMVNCGFPIRESSEKDVPSLMPLPTDGFDWHQRKRRRRRRRPGEARDPSPSIGDELTIAATSQLPSPPWNTDNDDVSALDSQTGQRSLQSIVKSEPSKGVVNGEACAAAAVVAATEGQANNGKRRLGLGRLLVSDWRVRESVLETQASARGVDPLTRKRRRMEKYSERRREWRQKLERVRVDQNTICERVDGSLASQPGTEIEGFPTAAPTRAQIESRPGARRGRNDTLRMRARRTSGVLGRRLGNRVYKAEQRRDRQRRI